ncbi:MAG: hypothetical protein J7M08_04440, partial [Planctomycetes bacterium]|nr:hypothetical protein [Planctomycetota bacterium]
TWKETMEYHHGADTKATFTGEPTARHDGEKISARTLQVAFDQNMRLARITAEGQAVMDVTSSGAGENKDPSETGNPLPTTLLPGVPPGKAQHWRISCGSLVILPAEKCVRSTTSGTFTLEGEASSGSISWQEKMNLNSVEGYAEFSGHVVARVSGAELASDRLRLDFNPGGELRHASAKDNVHFISGGENSRELTSDSAEAVFAADNALRQIIARGQVEFFDQEAAVHADRLQLFLESSDADKRSSISRGLAEGNVWLSYRKEDLEAGGDRLSLDRQTDVYVLTGEPYAYVQRGGVKTQNWKITLNRQTGKMVLPPGERPATWSAQTSRTSP